MLPPFGAKTLWSRKARAPGSLLSAEPSHRDVAEALIGEIPELLQASLQLVARTLELAAPVVERYATVRGFVKMLCRVIEFGATADAQKVLAAMRDLPGLLDARPTGRVPKDYLDARRGVSVDLVPGGWCQRLVFPHG